MGMELCMCQPELDTYNQQRTRQPTSNKRKPTTATDSNTWKPTGSNRQPTFDNQQQTTTTDKYARQLKLTTFLLHSKHAVYDILTMTMTERQRLYILSSIERHCRNKGLNFDNCKPRRSLYLPIDSRTINFLSNMSILPNSYEVTNIVSLCVYGPLTFQHKLDTPSKRKLERRPLCCASCYSLCLKPDLAAWIRNWNS